MVPGIISAQAISTTTGWIGMKFSTNKYLTDYKMNKYRRYICPSDDTL